MALDASIVGGLKQFQLESPIENYSKAMTLQNLMQKGQMDQITLQQHQQAQAEDNQMRGYVTQSGGDMQKLRDLTYGGGLYKQGQAQDKAMAEQAKAKAEAGHLGAQTGKLQSETLNMAIGRHKEQLNSVNSYEGAVDWVRRGYADPEMTAVTRGGNLEQSLAEIPQDPAGFQKWKMQGSLSADQLLKMTKPDANAVLQAQTTTAGQQSTAATAAASLDQRADQFGQTMEAGKKQIVQSDNGPVLVNTKTGVGQVVNGPDGMPLAGVTKPLNDSQSKALLFGSRMRDADKIMSNLAAEGKTNSVAGSRASYIGGLVNAASSDNNQMLNQAKTDFMTAILRRESGAAISSGEFDTADKQYFPQIGDSPGVIAQKAANRQLAIKGVLVEVPEKQRGSLQATPSSPGKESAPKSGVVQDGYKFMGGDPSKPTSWQKVGS